jgi:hypothetical protein
MLPSTSEEPRKAVCLSSPPPFSGLPLASSPSSGRFPPPLFGFASIPFVPWSFKFSLRSPTSHFPFRPGANFRRPTSEFPRSPSFLGPSPPFFFFTFASTSFPRYHLSCVHSSSFHIGSSHVPSPFLPLLLYRTTKSRSCGITREILTLFSFALCDQRVPVPYYSAPAVDRYRSFRAHPLLLRIPSTKCDVVQIFFPFCHNCQERRLVCCCYLLGLSVTLIASPSAFPLRFCVQ